MKKRLLTLLLATVLCLAVCLPALAIDDYPDQYKYAPKDSLVDEWRFYNRECVSFVAWCLNSRNGIEFSNYTGSGWWGNANTWASTARSLGYRVDTTPAVGAVAYWDSGYYGHVAWVAAVDGDNVTIEEYNYDPYGNYYTRTISASTPTGYIHIKDLSGSYSVKAPSALSVTFENWNDEGYTYIAETDASLGQLITVENGSCTEVGMQLYDADGTLVAEAFREPGNSGKVWFCLNDDCDYQLEPATRYSYCFYAVVDGNTYWGEEQEFRSAGDYLSLDRSELYLVSGSSAVICADYQPADAVVDWHSSNRSVATVKDGLVSAVEPGTAVISARVGTAYAKCTVTVTGSPAAAGSEGAGSAAGVHFKAVAAYEEGQFSDVTPEQWFYASVVNGYELGLIKGSAASLFNPDGQVSLAEAVTMACRIHSTYTGKELLTEASPWYQPYLDYAYANGIINGELYQSDVTQMATRAQFAEIFAHALPDKALYPINEVDDGAVPDVDADAENAAAIYRLYRAGILSGSDAYGTFKPDSHVTRAEAAVILSRMANSDQRVEVSL